MGAGIAVKFKQLFGGVDELRKQNASCFTRKLLSFVIIVDFLFQVKTGGCAVLKDKDRYIYYLVTKDKTGTGFYPTYDSLESSLKEMLNHMVANNVTELAIPQIGCGLDGLKWEEVEARIRNVFKESDVEITVYKYVPPN